MGTIIDIVIEAGNDNAVQTEQLKSETRPATQADINKYFGWANGKQKN